MAWDFSTDPQFQEKLELGRAVLPGKDRAA